MRISAAILETGWSFGSEPMRTSAVASKIICKGFQGWANSTASHRRSHSPEASGFKIYSVTAPIFDLQRHSADHTALRQADARHIAELAILRESDICARVLQLGKGVVEL